MTPLASFLPFVLPHAQSVPDVLAEQYLRQAAMDFCRETRSWRTTTEIDVAGEAHNDVPLLTQSQLFEIEDAWFKLVGGQYDKPLLRIPYDLADPNLLPTGATPANGAVPSAITQDGPGSIILLPPAAGKLKISMFLMPTVNADSVADYLFTKHATTLASGALSHLLMIPDQPYTNPNIAALHGGLFRQTCDRLFNLNRRGQQRAPARARSSFV